MSFKKCACVGEYIWIKFHLCLQSTTVVEVETKTLSYMNELHLSIPLRSVTNSLDDLRIASHKVDNIEDLILEQDWKIKHSTVHSHLLFMSCIGMVTTSLTLICLCYCCCSECCCRRCPKFSEWWKDNNPCTWL